MPSAGDKIIIREVHDDGGRMDLARLFSLISSINWVTPRSCTPKMGMIQELTSNMCLYLTTLKAEALIKLINVRFTELAGEAART